MPREKKRAELVKATKGAATSNIFIRPIATSDEDLHDFLVSSLMRMSHEKEEAIQRAKKLKDAESWDLFISQVISFAGLFSKAVSSCTTKKYSGASGFCIRTLTNAHEQMLEEIVEAALEGR